MTEIKNGPGIAIDKFWPIRVWEHSPAGNTRVIPGLSNIEAIPTLWRVPHQVHDDRLREAATYTY